MSKQLEELQHKIQHKPKKVDNNLSHSIEISDEEVVKIIGGAYMQAANETFKKNNTTLAQCGNGTGGSCDVCTP